MKKAFIISVILGILPVLSACTAQEVKKVKTDDCIKVVARKEYQNRIFGFIPEPLTAPYWVTDDGKEIRAYSSGYEYERSETSSVTVYCKHIYVVK